MYAANAGSGLERLTSSSSQAKGDGVFVDRVGMTAAGASRYSLDQITAGDGTTNTLMVTEKCGTAVVPQMDLFGQVNTPPNGVQWSPSQSSPKVVLLPWVMPKTVINLTTGTQGIIRIIGSLHRSSWWRERRVCRWPYRVPSGNTSTSCLLSIDYLKFDG